MDYQEVLDYIYSFIDYETTTHMPHLAIYYDLRRMGAILERIGNPHLAAKSVHVAGSKGKGSTCAMIASALIESGYRTGFFSKPHLIDLRERFRVDNELMTEQELIELGERLRPEVTAYNAVAPYGRLTTFELLTTIGFAYFQKKNCDVQVIEVGLGGEFDATNIIPLPEVACITSLSYEHTDVLGNTLTEIAHAKAGIIKGGVVVSHPQVEEAAKVLREKCAAMGAKLLWVGQDVTYKHLGFSGGRQMMEVKGRLGTYELAVPLIGYYQLDNAANAVGALEVLMEKGYHVTRDSIEKGIARVSWPGRFQILARNPTIIIDGAHNPDSAHRLREAVEMYFNRGGSSLQKDARERYNHAILITGTSEDKDISGIAEEWAPLFDKVIVTRSVHPRASETDRIVAEFKKRGVEPQITDTVPNALKRARELATKDDIICATGSLFIVGEMIHLVTGAMAAT